MVSPRPATPLPMLPPPSNLPLPNLARSGPLEPVPEAGDQESGRKPWASAQNPPRRPHSPVGPTADVACPAEPRDHHQGIGTRGLGEVFLTDEETSEPTGARPRLCGPDGAASVSRPARTAELCTLTQEDAVSPRGARSGLPSADTHAHTQERQLPGPSSLPGNPFVMQMPSPGASPRELESCCLSRVGP